ncbi:DUF1211 domain-containing protein [Ginsengibacter hankyongi]|uniref:DUF1211 domain-containing protein n=1 Tax=Ginsengibacter hankyongi TaxID=2607284 RepID=A0A5J5ICM8_9BACT|nr:TMEM175 family protein [Ginsengibacter hankyongi]KAA9035924.1 DUF1211 domain-containing protein [Ginsengibacter hankyongi]
MEEKEKVTLNETSRIEAFSDGVFAIAITLLILEIHVPVAKENETLLSSLLHEWTSFLALLIGFFTLLVCWINHHYIFSMVYKSNSVLSLVNGFKLLVVTITPFATALLAKNIATNWEQAAVNIYCFNFALMGCSMTCIWLYAKRKGFIDAGSDIKLRKTTRLYIFAGVFSTSIWLVSYISLIACLILFMMMFIIFIFPEKIISLQLGRSNKKRIVFSKA